MKKELEQLSEIEMNAMTALAMMLDEKANSRNSQVEGTRLSPKVYERIIELKRIETPYGDFVYTDTSSDRPQEVLFFSYDKKTKLTRKHTLQRKEVSDQPHTLTHFQSEHRKNYNFANVGK